jgi:hypothetical protein
MMSEETENEIVETAYSKGVRLESEFSEFLKSDLGWEKTRNRKQMRSKWNMAGTNVDIIAERINEKGERFRKSALLLIALAVPILLIGFYLVFDEDYQNDGIGNMLLTMGFIWEIGAALFAYLSHKLNKENAWIECKNIKTKSTIKQMQILVAERNAFVSSKDDSYKIVETYFVAENGFTETALQYAESHDVLCYEKANGKFVKAKYWN